MPHMSNVNFPENKFALSILHTTENNFKIKKKSAWNKRMEHFKCTNAFGFEK